jgi:uncharacterized protein (TIGR00251 family)
MSTTSTLLRLRVAPGRARTQVEGRHGDAWKLSVTAPAEGGKANDAVLALLAATLRVSRSAVSLVSGRSARSKVVRLTGLEAAEADRRLAAAASPRRKPV